MFIHGILGAVSILEISNILMFLVCVFTHGKCGALKILQGSSILFINGHLFIHSWNMWSGKDITAIYLSSVAVCSLSVRDTRKDLLH